MNELIEISGSQDKVNIDIWKKYLKIITLPCIVVGIAL